MQHFHFLHLCCASVVMLLETPFRNVDIQLLNQVLKMISEPSPRNGGMCSRSWVLLLLLLNTLHRLTVFSTNKRITIRVESTYFCITKKASLSHHCTFKRLQKSSNAHHRSPACCWVLVIRTPRIYAIRMV
jgi:hypothetical protein